MGMLLRCWIFLTSISVCQGETWKVTTACFGSDVKCSQYTMECAEGQYIAVGQLKYGTKTDQRCLFGVSDCDTEAARVCCWYDPMDKMTDFSEQNRSNVISNCEGNRTCNGWAPRIATLPSSTYVWMQYACVNDTGVADMCSPSTVVGNELFLQFNFLPGFKTPIPDGITENCECKISSGRCDDHLNLTFIDMTLKVALAEDINVVCSNITVKARQLNQTFHCGNNSAQSVPVMKTFGIGFPTEIISLENIPKANPPGEHLLLYATTVSNSLLMIQCFPAGTRATIPDVCETTTSSAASLSETTSALLSTYSVNKTITTKPTTSHTATLSTVPALPTLSSLLSHIPSDTEPTSSTLSAEQTIDIYDQTKQSTSFVNTEALTTTTPPFSHTSAYSESSSTSPPTTYRVSPTILHHSTLVSDTSSSSNALTLTSLTTFEETTSPITATPATVLTKALTKPTDKLQTTDSNMNSSRLMLTMSLPLNRTLTGSSIDSTLKSYTATHTLSNDTLLATKQTAGSDSGVNHSSDIPNTSGDSNIATVTVTDTKHSTPIATLDENDGGGDNSGVIIGITVAIVLLMVVVVGILVVCLWHRVKRKEAVRRNYVRNTNIFYSFPQDYDDMENTRSESPVVARKPGISEEELSYIAATKTPVLNGIPPSKASNGSVKFDSYRIKPPDITLESKDDDEDVETVNAMYDSSYSHDTQNETISYFCGTEKEPAESDHTDTTQRQLNATKSVSFDESALYARVVKEGKTKF